MADRLKFRVYWRAVRFSAEGVGMFPLEMIEVASPCPADWSKMEGDDRTRFCGQCERHVYHLSGMTRGEAEALVRETEGRVCVRFYRRADGTVLTADCPVGLAAAWRRGLRKFSTVTGAVVGSVLGVILAPALFGSNRGSAWARTAEPFATVLNWIDPQPQRFDCVMGAPLPVLTQPPPGGGGPGEPIPDPVPEPRSG